jgi:hypothetical protein
MISPIFLPILLAASQSHQGSIVQPTHQQIMQAWLAGHPGSRIATEMDCGDCADQINAIRRGMGGVWKSVPEYQPYYLVGDLNGDGHKDFAIVVVMPGKSAKRFILLVFNGPFQPAKPQQPSFVSGPMDLAGQGLFFGPPRPRPYRLLVGGFESEGRVLLPRGSGYAWSPSSHGGG